MNRGALWQVDREQRALDVVRLRQTNAYRYGTGSDQPLDSVAVCPACNRIGDLEERLLDEAEPDARQLELPARTEARGKRRKKAVGR